jgi:1,4-alpha-glucan branching enzyme
VTGDDFAEEYLAEYSHGCKPGQWRQRDFSRWAPLAAAVYLNGTFGGTPRTGQTDDLLLAKDANGYWTGFVDAANEGDLYRFWVVGPRWSN